MPLSFCFVFILITVYQVEVDSMFTNLFVFEKFIFDLFFVCPLL